MDQTTKKNTANSKTNQIKDDIKQKTGGLLKGFLANKLDIYFFNEIWQ
jgi:hypothetical protein